LTVWLHNIRPPAIAKRETDGLRAPVADKPLPPDPYRHQESAIAQEDWEKEKDGND
jgi:hypothetical protein